MNKITISLIFQYVFLSFVLITPVNADFCNNYVPEIEKAPDQYWLIEISNKYMKECKGSSSGFYYHLAKKFYEFNVYDQAKKFLEAAKNYTARSDTYYPHICYYLVLIELESSPPNLHYIQDALNDVWSHPEHLKRHITEKIRSKYIEILNQFCSNPIEINLPQELIQLINRFEIGNILNLPNCIVNEIKQQESTPQSQKQAVNLLILYEKLKLFQMNYENKIFQYQALTNYYEQADEADITPLSKDKCQLYTDAIDSLKRAINKSDTENALCKKNIFCLDSEIINTFHQRFQSIQKDSSTKNQSQQWQEMFTRFNNNCLAVIPDDIKQLKTHMDIYVSITRSIDHSLIQEFITAYDTFKEAPLVQDHHKSIISSLIHSSAESLMAELTVEKPYTMNIQIMNKKARMICQKAKNTLDFFQNSDLRGQVDINDLLSKPVKQSSLLFDITQHLLKGDGKTIEKIKPQLDSDIWTAWHINEVLEQKKICYLQLTNPTSLNYNFNHYQIQSIPEIFPPGHFSEKCMIIDRNKCKIKLPVNIGFTLSFLSEIQVSESSFQQKQQAIVSLKKGEISKDTMTVSIPHYLFHNICLSAHSPMNGKCNIYHFNNYADSPVPVVSFPFEGNQKCIDLLPGIYLYSFDFYTNDMLNIWFHKLNVTGSQNKPHNILTYVNRMNTEKKAHSYFNACLSSIERKMFKKADQKAYMAHSKGTVEFFKYLFSWYFHQRSRSPLLWKQLIQPITRQSDKWKNHYRIPQLKILGIDVPEKKEDLTCRLVYAILDLIANQRPEKNYASQDRKLYRSILNTIRIHISDNNLFRQLEEYAYE